MENTQTRIPGRLTVIPALLLLFLLCAGAPARAAREYDVQQHLNFGTFSVAHNAGVYHVIVAPDGSTSYSPGIYPDVQAQPGIYLLTGLPPGMKITLGTYVASPPLNGGLKIDNSTGLTFGGSPPFTVGSFTCNNPTTDGAGNATLLIGATLTTSGSGSYYDTGMYHGTIDLTFYLD